MRPGLLRVFPASLCALALAWGCSCALAQSVVQSASDSDSSQAKTAAALNSVPASDQPKHVGGNVTAPVLLHSDSAPRANAGGNAPAAPYAADPHFASAWKDAKQYEAMQQTSAAIGDYKKANKIAAGLCAECMQKVYLLAMKIGEYKDAAGAASGLEAMATSPTEKSRAEAQRAQALYAMAGDKPKPDRLRPADEALKAAIADDPHNASARFFEGKVLAQMGQTDEARAQFQQSMALVSPRDPYYARAKHFAENPELSYQKRAPAFTVTALDGSKFTLDDMGGRVVLIDFWATWCGPCNEELPHMKKIAKEFAGQPFVMISVSWDADAAKWKDFIAKNEMTWVQYRDANHDLTNRFGISAIPHYFTIDSDGVLTSEMMGSGSDVEGKLKKLVARAKAAQAAAASAQDGAHAAAPLQTAMGN